MGFFGKCFGGAENDVDVMDAGERLQPLVDGSCVSSFDGEGEIVADRLFDRDGWVSGDAGDRGCRQIGSVGQGDDQATESGLPWALFAHSFATLEL